MSNSWEVHWKDYYQILQVHPTAEQEVIKAAYNRLARKYHPDVSQDSSSTRRMRDLNEAFEVLGNLEQRRIYHPVWLQERRESENTYRQGSKTRSTPPSETPRPTTVGSSKTKLGRQILAEIRRWRVESGGREYQIEYVANPNMRGDVLINGKVVASWGSSVWWLPKIVEFQIDHKPAVLRRTGIISQHFDLVWEGRVYNEKQGRV